MSILQINITKKVKLLRVLIYSSGLLVILLTLFLNTGHTERKLFEFSKNEPGKQIVSPVFLENNFDNVKIEMKLEKDQPFPKELEVFITKTYQQLTLKAGNTITESDELLAMLYENNSSEFPNGSLFKIGEDVYLLEKGKLRSITSIETFHKLGFDQNKLNEITRNELDKFEKGEKISSIPKPGSHLEGVIIKTDSSFYISGSSHYYPILSEKIIENVWSNFTYIETNDLAGQMVQKLKCLAYDADLIECTGNLMDIKLTNGDTYVTTVQGIPVDSIQKMNYEFLRKNTRAESIEKIKNMLW